ncbi:MAG: hypothetical protein R3212_14225, partial [Xanthomonadales bacterium]|nr:hypothetical protein [Xanthomonadales bacterium]
MPSKRRPDGNKGNTFSTRFSSKLFVAFGAMLLVMLALAWYFHDTVEWYEHDIGEIARTNDVLQDYQSLARQT